MRRYQVTLEDGQAHEVASLAYDYGLTEQAVLEQLVAIGLEQLGEERRADEGRLRR